MPVPQQCQIPAVMATYTAAHINTRTLTQRARPGVEPATSWFLVRFGSDSPWHELLLLFIILYYLRTLHADIEEAEVVKSVAL